VVPDAADALAALEHGDVVVTGPPQHHGGADTGEPPTHHGDRSCARGHIADDTPARVVGVRAPTRGNPV
jgi:hypothetical protein